MTWYGWYRDGSSEPWERVCQAHTIEECHSKLIQERKRRPDGFRPECGYITQGSIPPDSFNPRGNR